MATTSSHASPTHPNLAGLQLGLVITLVMMVAELGAGWYSHSLALLADAGHMASDAVALGLTLLAFRIARQPATRTKTYGYHRTEILAAFLNGLALWLVVIVVLSQALHRFFQPSAVKAVPMLVTAIAGLLANGLCGWLLCCTKGSNLNLQGAFLHVVADALGSLSVIIAGLVIWRTGWLPADPVASVAVCVVILISSWRLITQSVNVLLEGSPAHINVPAVMRAMRQVAGVKTVHDVHVWTITSGMEAMSAHVVVNDLHHGQAVLDALNALLRSQYHIDHTTLQLESPDRKSLETQR